MGKPLSAYLTKKTEERYRFTFEVPMELAERLMAAVQEDGLTLRQVMEASAKRYLDERKGK